MYNLCTVVTRDLPHPDLHLLLAGRHHKLGDLSRKSARDCSSELQVEECCQLFANRFSRHLASLRRPQYVKGERLLALNNFFGVVGSSITSQLPTYLPT